MAVGLGFAFILLTVAELFGANAEQDGSSNTTPISPTIHGWSPAFYTGLVTYLAMTLLDSVRQRALFWLR